MSVLVEETSLVARRDDLDENYPGGADAFVEAAFELALPPRFVSDDEENLVSLSFHDTAHARDAIVMLEGLDVNWVIVEPSSAPIPTVSWLESATYSRGVVGVWLAGAKPGKLALPEGWTPATSHEFDIRTPEDRERMLRLAVEDGVETFLDLETGAQVTSETNPLLPTPPSATPLHDALMAAISTIGWRSYFNDAPAAHVDLKGKSAVYTSRYWANEPADTVLCLTRAPLTVPLRARRRATDFITRVNCQNYYGSFDLDLDDGRLACRSTVDVEGSVLSEQVVRNLASNNVYLFDKYYPFLLEVVYGNRTPRDAFEAAEKQ